MDLQANCSGNDKASRFEHIVLNLGTSYEIDLIGTAEGLKNYNSPPQIEIPFAMHINR